MDGVAPRPKNMGLGTPPIVLNKKVRWGSSHRDFPDFSRQNKGNRGRSSVRLERLPVTQEAASSNLVDPASLQNIKTCYP